MDHQGAITQFLDDVAHEYVRAMGRYPPLHSAHEAYAVILEELQEFWDWVRQQDARRNPMAMRQELMQVAAMCLRAVMDLGLYEGKPSDVGQIPLPL